MLGRTEDCYGDDGFYGGDHGGAAAVAAGSGAGTDWLVLMTTVMVTKLVIRTKLKIILMIGR